ncbi:MAG TPA: D-glycero-beta-D-manno-heptose-7-phosphate kinase [Methylomirabilota bacterium]|jgi:D-beta-D-heptose 7-phosphate kinase/D-beta-D-heptose 1-phosphate adenosyltransferase|nr:D-glycero-beta-D-manno-heptose-7-phosphate kinase [Methylomirabilota bacterium]
MQVLRCFTRARVLVIGDLMLDRYIWGRVQRISPEAPIPIVQITRESLHAGGAANVVANIRALGGQVTTCGVVGKDSEGTRLVHELSTIGASTAGVITSRLTQTTTKTRIIAHNQQVVRLDREQEDLDSRVRARLHTFVARHIDQFDVVVVSDYGKGAIDSTLLTLLADLRRQRRFLYLIDPKRKNFRYYRRASLVKPNLAEAALAAGMEIKSAQDLSLAGTRLLDLWQAEAVLVSRGEEGMSLFKSGASPQHFPATAREVFDVTGAGDTVLAICALALGAGATLENATILANYAAGVVVGKVGTATVNLQELEAILSKKRLQ